MGAETRGKPTQRAALVSGFSFSCRWAAQNQDCEMLATKPKGTSRENIVSLVTAYVPGFSSHLINL